MSVRNILMAAAGASTAAPPGQVAYTTPGTYSWTAPDGVTSVCVVCVGGGGAGNSLVGNFNHSGAGGGGLGWKNGIPVTPGQSYTVVVGGGGAVGDPATEGGSSYFINGSTVAGLGGKIGSWTTGGTVIGGVGGTFVGNGGGNGGAGGDTDTSNLADLCGGGGAGGYSGPGGQGGSGDSGSAGGAGAGGGGAGGASSAVNYGAAYCGGGVGLLGQGANGSGAGAYAGGGGSGGAAGNAAAGGAYGGGGAATLPGAPGAVRIIWGAGRAFPSTNTGDM